MEFLKKNEHRKMKDVVEDLVNTLFISERTIYMIILETRKDE